MPNPKVKMKVEINAPGDGSTVTVGPDKKVSVSIDAWAIVLRGGGGSGGGSGGDGGSGGGFPGGGKKPPGGGVQPKGGRSLQGNGGIGLQRNLEIEAGAVLVKMDDGDFQEATKTVLPRRWGYSEAVRRAGDVQITARARPPAGHQGDTAETTHTVNVKVDREAPHLTIKKLPQFPKTQEIEVTSGSKIDLTVAGTVSDDSGVESLHVGVDEASERVELDGRHWQHQLTLNGFGRHEIHVRAVDRVGNRASERRRVETVDAGPPELVISAPRDDTVGWPEDGDLTVEFRGRASDDGSGVRSVKWRVGDDGRFVDAQDASDGGDWSRWQARVPIPARGEHVVHFRCRDKAGNEEDVRVTLHAVDRSPPEVRITEPRAGTHEVVEEEGGVTVEVQGRAQDAIAEVAVVEWSLDGGEYEPVEQLADDWSEWRFSVHLDQLGDHPVRVRAADSAGNISEPRELLIKVFERV